MQQKEIARWVAALEAGRDGQEAFDAAMEVVRLRSQSATRPLLRLVRPERAVHVRLFAVFALRLLEDPRAMAGLIDCARRDGEACVRDEAVEALGVFVRKRRQRALRAVVEACGDESAAVRWTAAFVLGMSGEARVVPVLERMLVDEEAPSGNTTVGEAAREAMLQIRGVAADGVGEVT